MDGVLLNIQQLADGGSNYNDVDRKNAQAIGKSSLQNSKRGGGDTGASLGQRSHQKSEPSIYDSEKRQQANAKRKSIH